MRYLLLTALAALQLFAQPTLSLIGTTQTQAVLAIRHYIGNCTLEVSESDTYSPLMPDVNATLYLGSNVDAARPDTITWTDGTRVVTLGHQTDDRALAAATNYYVRVSGCGGTATTHFRTATIGLGNTAQWPVPFNPNKPGNLGYPTIDLVNPKTYVDPVSGVKMRPLNVTRHWGYRTGGNSAANSEAAAIGSNSFDTWTGGAGWNNPASILSGAASSASTSGTSPIDLYFSVDSPWAGFRTFDDLGIVVAGGGSSASTADRQIQICIFLNPSQGCIGTPITVTLPQGGVQAVASSAADGDHPFPSSFPSPLFAGWGINVPIRIEYQQTQGTLSASNGNLSINDPNWQQHFSDGHTAGARMRITGSGCQPNDMCTVAAYNSAISARVNEQISGTFSFTSYGMGVRVWKSNANGQVTVGLRYKVAGSRTTGVQAGIPPCGYVKATAADGKRGYVCEVPSPQTGSDWLYFVMEDGSSRRFGFAATPNHQAQLNSMPVGDRPNSGANVPYYPLGYDSGDAAVFYAAMPNNSGSLSIFKLTYNGDFTQDVDFQYLGGPGGDTPDALPGAVDNIVWSNLMAPSQGMDLQSQISARFPNYNSAIYGTWTAGQVGFDGISGNKAFFSKVYSGQDGGPAWLAVVDLPSGVVSKLIHTADGTGTNGIVRWGSLHSFQAEPAVPNSLLIVDNPLAANDPTHLHGGPFQAPITGLMRGGSWSANTALSWPPDSSYDSTCPAGNPYEFMGATANQCAVIRVPRGGVCNYAPTPLERSTWPCPWNGNYAQPFALTVGSVFGNSAGSVDDEKFRIVAMSTEPDNQIKLTVQRNAMWDYCCIVNTHVNNGTSNCIAQPSLAFHNSGWSIRMYPANLNGCATGSFVYNLANDQIGEIGRTLGGHATIAAGLSPGKLGFINSGAIKADATFSELFALPTTFVRPPAPSFQGVPLPIGTNFAQSYPGRILNNLTADKNAIPWMMDTNAHNPGLGLPREAYYNGIGPRTLTPVATDIYKIQVMGTLSYKSFPLIGWAGRNTLRDVSAPGSNLASASNYSICHAFRAGECVGSSAANEVFVKVPNVYDPGSCTTGVGWANIPCVTSGLPSGGGSRQQSIARVGQDGDGSRFLGYIMAHPGQHYPYTEMQGLTDGKTAIMAGSHITEGWGSIGWVVQLPPWEEDNVTRDKSQPIEVQVPGGSTYAEVQFGYARFGAPGQFFCTARAEACNTSSLPTSPYNFESETRALQPCPNGCKIKIPAVAGNLMYMRIRKTMDGVTWVNGNIEAIPLP